MSKKILLLGHTGKMGTALVDILQNDYEVIGKNTSDFDALNFEEVENLIKENKPDIVINSVAMIGIDPCEKNPDTAIKLNALYPRLLAGLSNRMKFLLIHFSTDAVFDDEKKDFYLERDCPHPLNMYGLTKYGGDCFIEATSEQYYLFRISVLFGETSKNTQFVEKMLHMVKQGQTVLRVSGDIILSPTYTRDVVKEIKRILEIRLPFGLYHIANSEKGSLCELIKEIVKNLKLDVKVKEASYKDFPHLGRKNTYTPLKSEKIPSLRPWREAVKEYCTRIKDRF